MIFLFNDGKSNLDMLVDVYEIFVKCYKFFQ